MYELTIEEVNDVSGAIHWGEVGMGLIAFAGAAAVMGYVGVGAVLGIAGVVCICIDWINFFKIFRFNAAVNFRKLL